MVSRAIRVSALILVVSWAACVVGQQPSPGAVVPTMVRFDGTLADANGKPLSGTIGITFLLYKDSQGGSPLWMETQNVRPDSIGHYSIMLGSESAHGLPTDLFSSGDARWLAVQAEGQEEQPRVLLLSVPYALKAADAETIGGLPPSAFLLAPPPGTATPNPTVQSTASSAALAPALSGTGMANYLPLWTGTTALGSSVLYQTGTGGTAKIGINTTTPATALDVKGAATLRGNLSFPATGTATAAAGKNSQPLSFTASVFNSSSTTPVNQNFRWQAEPVGNNTVTATGSLNLLFAQGTGAYAETGLRLGHDGVITFAPAQNFPGTGPGTITGVTAGTALTGGGTSGAVKLNVDKTKVPLLAAATNNFTGNLNVGGGLGIGTTSPAYKLEVDSGDALVRGANNFQVNGHTANLFVGDNNHVVQATFGGGLTLGTYLFPTAFFIHDVDGHTAVGYLNSYNTLAQLAVIGNVPGDGAFLGQGWGGASAGVGEIGEPNPNNGMTGAGVVGWGGGGSLVGAPGLIGYGGGGRDFDGAGGVFHGGNGSSNGSGDGLDAFAGSGFAGVFSGSVEVNGNLSKTSGSFKIDHPLDPANKYLYHSFVESPDMMNIYNGVATLDAAGEAVIQMPEWFGALNRDFRYQLTCIGGFAPVYIAQELANNQFKIGGGHAGMKISWQITGIRQDAWANAHRIPVEEPKTDRERGFYLHPELYGAPEEKSVAWARHPETMRRFKEARPDGQGPGVNAVRSAAVSAPAEEVAK